MRVIGNESRIWQKCGKDVSRIRVAIVCENRNLNFFQIAFTSSRLRFIRFNTFSWDIRLFLFIYNLSGRERDSFAITHRRYRRLVDFRAQLINRVKYRREKRYTSIATNCIITVCRYDDIILFRIINLDLYFQRDTVACGHCLRHSWSESRDTRAVTLPLCIKYKLGSDCLVKYAGWSG